MVSKLFNKTRDHITRILRVFNQSLNICVIVYFASSCLPVRVMTVIANILIFSNNKIVSVFRRIQRLIKFRNSFLFKNVTELIETKPLHLRSLSGQLFLGIKSNSPIIDYCSIYCFRAYRCRAIGSYCAFPDITL